VRISGSTRHVDHRRIAVISSAIISLIFVGATASASVPDNLE
jgi:hypothetical protein